MSVGRPEGTAKLGQQIALGLTSLLVLYWFWPEIKHASLFYNDAISHIAMIRGMDETWKAGGNITDFWMAYINFGHAVFRSYQFLFHLAVWLAHKTIFAGLTLESAFNVCVTIMAMSLPWSFYKGGRLLGMGRTEATIASIALVLIHERDGYGLGLTNFTFSGYGIYNQLFAMLFFPLTIGLARRMLFSGRGALQTSLAFSATFMAHILTGYFACIWIGIDALVMLAFKRNRHDALRVLRSLITFGGLTLLWTGHWVIPMAQDNLLQHRSEFEAAYKWSGLGAEVFLRDFFSGAILDAGRQPVLTVLGALGFLFCSYSLVTHLRAARKRLAEEAFPATFVRSALVAQSAVWLLLSFGTATWGALLEALPFSGSLHWHRFFAGLQVAWVMAIGVLLSWVASRLKLSRNNLHLGATSAIVTILLLPCLKERQEYFLKTNLYWLKDSEKAWENPNTSAHQLLKFALEHPDARYEMGNPWTWGNKLKVSQTTPLFGMLSQFNIENVGAIYHHQNHSEVLAFKSDALNPQHAELMNVRYVGLPVQNTPPKHFKKILETSTAAIYDNGNSSGYFAVGPELSDREGCATNDILSRSVAYYLAKSPLLAAHVYPRMRLARSCEGLWTAEDELLRLEREHVTRPLPGYILSSSKQSGPTGDIHSAKVYMERPGTLLFKMNYHPSWKATVNDLGTPTHLVVPSFVAIRLPAGTHEIRFTYEVAPLKRALLWVSIVALLALGGWSARIAFGRSHGPA